MLLAAGDLTFNGEKLSHETVAGLFEEIEAAGVSVLTLPGNHDVNNGMAYRYTGNTAEPTETVTAQEIREIYRAYGWEDSLLRDTVSMSYVWEPAEDLWIIAIDGNTDSHSGWVDDETLAWLDKVLTQAEEEGKAVLTFSEADRELMLEAAGEFNLRYFTGRTVDYQEELAALPGYALWNELPDGMGDYFAFILDSEKKDETRGDFGSLWLKGENT